MRSGSEAQTWMTPADRCRGSRLGARQDPATASQGTCNEQRTPLDPTLPAVAVRVARDGTLDAVDHALPRIACRVLGAVPTEAGISTLVVPLAAELGIDVVEGAARITRVSVDAVAIGGTVFVAVSSRSGKPDGAALRCRTRGATKHARVR